MFFLCCRFSLNIEYFLIFVEQLFCAVILCGESILEVFRAHVSESQHTSKQKTLSRPKPVKLNH